MLGEHRKVVFKGVFPKIRTLWHAPPQRAPWSPKTGPLNRAHLLSEIPQEHSHSEDYGKLHFNLFNFVEYFLLETYSTSDTEFFEKHLLMFQRGEVLQKRK